MTRDEVLALLAQHQAELAAFGLRRLALFGSVARNEAGPDSDIDVLVEFDGETTFRRYAKLYDCLEKILPRPVDLATANMIRLHCVRTLKKTLMRSHIDPRGEIYTPAFYV